MNSGKQIMTLLFTFIFSLSLTATFFGKSIVGFGGLALVLLSCVVLCRNIYTTNTHFNLTTAKDRYLTSHYFFIVAMFGAWLVSCLKGLDPSLSLVQWGELVGICIGGYLIYHATQYLDVSFERLFKIISILAGLCALILVLMPVLRPYLPFHWSSSYGSVLVIIIPLVLFLVVRGDLKSPSSWFWWGMAFVIMAAIFASGGRTAWLTLWGIIPIFILLFPWGNIKHKFYKGVLLIIFAVIASFTGLVSYKHIVGEGIYATRTNAMTSMERPASGRLTVWKGTVDEIMNYPVWGVGIKGSQLLNIEKGGGHVVRHVHNIVLEVLLETGVVGLLLSCGVILSFLLSFGKAYVRSENIAAKQHAMAVLIACIAYGVCSMALTSIFHAWWFLYLIFFLILLRISQQKMQC